MLQRAASNAYSWWWASHVRTKQSKWLEQNLQDMEEKVASVLKLIEEDGDSFARRAEMYYKKRPELIHFVEESYRAYRALAERYDHISTELQNANNTIASVFPEQVQFAMEDEDEEASPRFPKKSSDNSKSNVPKVPKVPTKDLKGFITSAKKMMQPNKKTKGRIAVSESGLTKTEGFEEIDKLQKRILALQTEKEFVKSSYEAGLTKYWEIDNEITEAQERICTLEDEFGEGRVIEDDEARRLMATTALKSCKQTLAQLQEKQERSVMEAEVEQKRIEDAREKLDSIKNASLGMEKPSARDQSSVAVEKPKTSEENSGNTTKKVKDMESLREKIKEHVEVSLGESLTVTEMAEKIDELVNKVINLETAVSSQTALIQRLRAETDELQAQIRRLENDKAALIDGKKDLRNKLSQMEEKLHGIQDLNQSIEDQNNNLQTHFTEANCSLDRLSEKLNSVKLDEEIERENSSSVEVKSSKKKKKSKEENSSSVKLDEKLERENSSSVEVKSSKKKKKSKDTQNKPEEARAGKESDVTDASVTENSPAEVKSQKGENSTAEVKSEKRENSPAEVKSEKRESSPSEVKSEKRENSPAEGKSQEGENSPAEVKSEKRESSPSEVKSEKRENSPAEVKPQKESKEKKSKNLDRSEGYKDMQSVPAEMATVSGSLTKEDDSLNLAEPQKQSEETGGKLDDANGFTKGGESKLEVREDAKLEVEEREDAKKQESVTTSTNEGGFSNETPTPSEKCKDLIAENKVDEQASSQPTESPPKVESKEQESKQDGEPDWKQLFLKGMEDREKTLLAEYTTMLRNYKDTKKKLTEVETKNQDGLFEITLQLRELKNTNAMKDEEIRSLRQKLNLFQAGLGENNNNAQSPTVSSEKSVATAQHEEEDDIGMMLINQSETTSEIEEKFRMNIDELLEENLDFWLRFSTAFHEIQRFETGVKDLVAEVKKLDVRRKQEGSSTAKYSVKSDVRPLYKHLREIQTELTLWVEKSVMLKEELKNRFSSLCDIQEEITTALKASAEDDDFKFTSYQAAKFQGEILNMKQENNKVADELQAGLDHVTTLQLEVERTLAKLSEDWGLSGSKSRHSGQLQHSESRSRVPLRSFIFGVKQKKQRTSIFSCVHPALHRKYNGLRSGLSSSNRS